MSPIHDFPKIRLDGGDISLNFVNTVDDRYKEPQEDHLINYTDLVNWANYAGGISNHQRNQLLKLSQSKPKEAKKIFREAIQLREAIYSFTLNLINRKKVSPDDVELINHWLSRAFSKLELIQFKDDFFLNWKEENYGLGSVLWPIIRSFAELITSDLRKRIKQCPNCGWMFVDGSKNSSRRWCNMGICGNLVKARRFARKSQS